MIAIGPSSSRGAQLNDEQQSATERLLESSWAQRERRASRRELVVDATAAGLFVAAAGSLAVAGDTAGLRPGIAALLIAIYAVVARIEFPVGAGYVVPTQLILVPMLLMLPPAVVPAAVGRRAGGRQPRSTGRCGRVPPRRVLSAVPDAWHAIGPALVLVLAGSPRHRLRPAAAAGRRVRRRLHRRPGELARARCAWPASCPTLQLQMRVIALVWAVDACLAPLGFLAAIAARQNDIAILFVLPLAFLLWLLARDRSQRIDQAHRRLKLVEQERARLQTAVRRLGDAFAAKLELNGLLGDPPARLGRGARRRGRTPGPRRTSRPPLSSRRAPSGRLDVLGAELVPKRDGDRSAGPVGAGGLDARHAGPDRRLAAGDHRARCGSPAPAARSRTTRSP